MRRSIDSHQQPNRLTGSTTNPHSYGHVAQLLILGAPPERFRVQQAPVCDSLCVYVWEAGAKPALARRALTCDS